MPEHITLVVHKELVIERRHEDTFRLFTESFGAWWPVATHSINEDKVLEAILDGREDGRIYERTVDGTECDWGIISDWDPPNGFTVSWKPNLDPEGHRTTWTIHFEADGEATRDHFESHWLGRLRRRCRESPGTCMTADGTW